MKGKMLASKIEKLVADMIHMGKEAAPWPVPILNVSSVAAPSRL